MSKFKKARDPELLDTWDACQLLDVSRETLWLWRKQGKITSIRLGGEHFYKYFDLENLKKSKAGRKTKRSE